MSKGRKSNKSVLDRGDLNAEGAKFFAKDAKRQLLCALWENLCVRCV